MGIRHSACKSVFAHAWPKCHHDALPILFICENWPLPVAVIDHMINRPGYFALSPCGRGQTQTAHLERVNLWDRPHPRRGDIPLLARHFLHKYSAKIGKKIDAIPLTVLETLLQYPWPGNVRELENVIERAVILAQGSTLHLDELIAPEFNRQDAPEYPTTLKGVQKSMIEKALEECRGIVEGKNGAAIRLGIAPSTLRDWVRKYDLK